MPDEGALKLLNERRFIMWTKQRKIFKERLWLPTDLACHRSLTSATRRWVRGEQATVLSLPAPLSIGRVQGEESAAAAAAVQRAEDDEEANSGRSRSNGSSAKCRFKGLFVFADLNNSLVRHVARIRSSPLTLVKQTSLFSSSCFYSYSLLCRRDRSCPTWPSPSMYGRVFSLMYE